MTSSLDSLVRIGKLKTEAPAREEFDGLVRSGLARLADAQNVAISLDGRFDLAYNAGHALALAALRWHGYRSENRFLVFQALTHTLDLPNEQWRVLDTAHKKRSFIEYERLTSSTLPLARRARLVPIRVRRVSTHVVRWSWRWSGSINTIPN